MRSVLELKILRFGFDLCCDFSTVRLSVFFVLQSTHKRMYFFRHPDFVPFLLCCLNCRGLGNLNELAEELRQSSVDICLLQETRRQSAGTARFTSRDAFPSLPSGDAEQPPFFVGACPAPLTLLDGGNECDAAEDAQLSDGKLQRLLLEQFDRRVTRRVDALMQRERAATLAEKEELKRQNAEWTKNEMEKQKKVHQCELESQKTQHESQKSQHESERKRVEAEFADSTHHCSRGKPEANR